MRYTLLLFSLICITVLFTANTTINDGFFDDLAFLGGGTEPVLPAEHYDYPPPPFPQHISNTSWGSNDNTVFSDITNAGATLGRVLFYDELLSANNNISCATCHDQAHSFADDTPFSMGVSTATDVNSMHLNDLGWSNNKGFFWDMSQANLEETILLPLTNPNEVGVTDMETLIEEMQATTYYKDLFAAAFGGPIINEVRIKKALTQFISSMTTLNSKFDQAGRGEILLNAMEAAGKKIFDEKCSVCHTDGQSEFLFINPTIVNGGSSTLLLSQFMFDNGLPLEENDLGAGAWNEGLTGLFKVPTLRNIDKTAPYMHDGRFESLEEVIEHYSEGVSESVTEWESPFFIDLLPEGGFDFSDFDKTALLHFLRSLTDETFLTDIKFSDPFALVDQEIEEEITEDEAPTKTTVFPNPSNGPLNVSFENPTQQQVQVYLLNMEGKLIQKMSSHKNGLSTDLSNLPAGMYVVRVFKNTKDWEDIPVILE